MCDGGNSHCRPLSASNLWKVLAMGFVLESHTCRVWMSGLFVVSHCNMKDRQVLILVM